MFQKNGFFVQFIKLAGPYWYSDNKDEIRRDTFWLIALTIMQMVIAVVITEWNAALFDALEQRSMSGLLTQTVYLVLIFLASITITTTHLVVKRHILIGWRLWLTEKVTGAWMTKGRHYQITLMGKNNHDNPDGRIAEDIRIATEEALALGHSLFYSVLLLVSFAKILWTLSGRIELDLGLFTIPVYGYLVWLAILYSIAASVLGWITGKPLTLSTHERQTEEANYRHDLITAQKNAQAIALIEGEAKERERLLNSFQGIIHTYALQTAAWKQIQIFTSGYSIVSMALPVLVVAPRYIIGAITLGTLMQSVQAFQQMTSALSWPVNNMAGIAKWRASVERVLGLVKAVEDIDHDISCLDERQICVGSTQIKTIKLVEVSINNLQGECISKTVNEEILPGEKVLLVGDVSSAVKLFQAIAGLWPWGQGHIEVPAGQILFFMPPRPYLPQGSLLNAICYPKSPSEFSQHAVEDLLRKVGLPEFATKLEAEDDWEQSLSSEQQQRLGVIRILLQQPQWVFIQEALDALPPEGETKMLKLLAKTLPNAAIVSISNQPTSEAFHKRKINI